MPKSQCKGCSCTKEKNQHAQRSDKYKCRVCKRYHPLRKCHKFQAMSVSERQNCVRKMGYCINCFAHDHQVKKCPSTLRCKQCKRPHHSMLHMEMRRDINSRLGSRVGKTAVRTSIEDVRTPDLVSHIRVSEAILLPTISCAVHVGDDVTTTVRCLLNTGSPHSYVNKSLVEKYGLEKHLLDETSSCWLSLESLHDESVIVEHLFRVKEIDLITPTVSLPPSCADLFRNIALADSRFFRADSIEVVIGMDLYNKVLIPGHISKPGQPDAKNTIFGYVITGAYAD